VEDGPDFICVGMPKAGTGWLYDQLDAHPDFWMPPVKELVYLNQEYPALKFVDENGVPVQSRKERLARKRGSFSPEGRERPGERLVHRISLDERDTAFLKYASSGRDKPMDMDFYAGLFQFRGGLKSGDITPPYCNLESGTIADIVQRFPAMKVLLLVRDPVARVWSRICMSHAGRGFDTALLVDEAGFRSYVTTTRKLGGLSATQTYLRWREHVPQTDLRVFFFDDLVREPARVRTEVLQFLGADPEKRSGAIPPDHNRKAKEKLEMTPLARAVLAEHFREELKASTEIFGGPACEWPALYGL
jgi:hypothetical protein